MTPAERIASDTWRRLGQAELLKARLGEETLTDLLVLDMLPHQRVNGFSIRHLTKQEESLFGADLLLCIRYPCGSGRRLALQAKKLYSTGRYGALAHTGVSGVDQIDRLDQFARRWGAASAYLLYNHVDPLPLDQSYWHCCRPHKAEQLGCTLVPSWSIRQAIGSRGGRTFRKIHEREPNRPWRCVFDCEKPIQQVDELARLQPELQLIGDKVGWNRPTPQWLVTDSDGFDDLLNVQESLSMRSLLRRLPRLINARDEVPGDKQLTYPRRILAVDVGDSGSDPERG